MAADRRPGLAFSSSRTLGASRLIEGSCSGRASAISAFACAGSPCFVEGPSPRSSLCDQVHRARAQAVKDARAKSRIPALTGAPDADSGRPGAGGRRTSRSVEPARRAGDPMEGAMALLRPWQDP